MKAIWKLFFILLYCSICDAVTRIFIKNFTCIFNPLHYSHGNCSVEKRSIYTWEINGHALALVSAPENITVLWKVNFLPSRSLSNKFRNVFRYEVNICDLLNDKISSPVYFFVRILTFTKKYTNLLTGCPYKTGHYYLNKFPFASNLTTLMDIKGTYILSMFLKFNKNTIFSTESFVELY